MASDNVSQDAAINHRIAQLRRWGALAVAAVVLLPRPLAIVVVLALGAVYTFLVFLRSSGIARASD